MWTTRSMWLDALRAWATPDVVRAACARAPQCSITIPTLIAVAEAMADYADHATGRNMAATRATIAARVGCSPRTVTTAWQVLHRTGWLVLASRGHGSKGTAPVGRRPSIWQISVPRRPVEFFHLPPSGGAGLLTPDKNYSPKALPAPSNSGFILKKTTAPGSSAVESTAASADLTKARSTAHNTDARPRPAHPACRHYLRGDHCSTTRPERLDCRENQNSTRSRYAGHRNLLAGPYSLPSRISVVPSASSPRKTSRGSCRNTTTDRAGYIAIRTHSSAAVPDCRTAAGDQKPNRSDPPAPAGLSGF